MRVGRASHRESETPPMNAHLVENRRKRKVGRPRKKPGAPVEHRLTPKVRDAIIAMVEDGMKVEDAAKSAGLTLSAIYKAMKNPPARQFYIQELRALLHTTKHLAAHALINELTGPNAAARVAAARGLIEANPDERTYADRGPQQSAGITIVIETGAQQPRVLGPPVIDVTPAREDEAALYE